jgi:hypothetical protein
VLLEDEDEESEAVDVISGFGESELSVWIRCAGETFTVG